MLLNAIVGFSASIRKSQRTLDGFLSDVIGGMPDAPPVRKRVRYSTDDDCIDSSIRFLYRGPDRRILLVGKSLGAVRTWWMLRSRWDAFERLLTVRKARIGVVLVDPHGIQREDGLMGSYGVRLKGMFFDPRWKRDDLAIRCLYQRNRYPKGARLDILKGADNAENTRLGEYADHWSVTDIGKRAGREVADQVQEVIRWLSGNDLQ